MSHNQRKRDALGMSYGSARHKLMRKLLFEYMKESKQDLCFQCGEPIELIDMTIEHKIPWLHANDPAKTFFDISNIAFSHYKCNAAAAANRGVRYR